ncbi:cytochrome c oxidase assembly protein [Arthrobacter sp. D1-17]
MKHSTVRAVTAGAVVLACGLGPFVVAFYPQAATEAGALSQTGSAVVWGLPLVKLMFNIAAAGALGSLVLALFALPPQGRAFSRALTLAGVSAALWALAGAGMSFLTFHSLANMALFSEGSSVAFISFLADVDAGRRGALSVLVAAAVALLCFAVNHSAAKPGSATTRASTLKRQRRVGLAALLSVAGLVPLALNSHAASGGGHPDSTLSVVLHMGAAAIWLGGLLALVLLRRSLDAATVATVVRRYSTLALVSFAALGVSGLLAGWAGLGSFAALISSYGAILSAKSAAFIVLGIFGALHRRLILARLERNPSAGGQAFAMLAVAELAVMGAASGLAAALARTPPPTIAEGAPLEEEGQIPSLIAAASAWKLDPLWSLVCGMAVFLYLAGLHRLRLQGRTWPVYRTVLWLVGVGLLFLVTNGGLHAAQEHHISAHVLTQMILTAVIPLFLVPAAPLTLAEATVHGRHDGTIGGAEVIGRAVRSALTATADPIAAAVGLAATLAVLYYTPLLQYSSASQLGYAAMTALALVSGCLFTASLWRSFGVPSSSTVTVRLLALGAVAALYGFHGWALAQQPDQLPDARREPWQITVDSAVDLFLRGAEPAGVAMWTLAAATLALVAAVMLLQPRIRLASLEDDRAGTEHVGDWTEASASARIAVAQADSGPNESPHGQQTRRDSLIRP